MNESVTTDNNVANHNRWIWLVPLSLFLGAISVFGVLTSFTPRFRSSSLLERNDDYLLQKAEGPRESLAESESAIVFSSVVLEPVLNDPELRKSPSLADPATAEKNLRGNLTVESVGSVRMQISYTGLDRHAAADVCNAVTESYLRFRNDARRERINESLQLLLPEIDKWKREVETKDDRVRKLEAEAGLDGPPGMTSLELAVEAIKSLRQEIRELEVSITVLEAQTEVSGGEPDEIRATESDDLSRLRIKRDVLRDQYRVETARAELFASDHASLRFARADLERAMQVLGRLQDRAVDVRATSPSPLLLVTAAVPSSMPVEGVPFETMALAGCGGLLIPLVLGALLGRRRQPSSVSNG